MTPYNSREDTEPYLRLENLLLFLLVATTDSRRDFSPASREDTGHAELPDWSGTGTERWCGNCFPGVEVYFGVLGQIPKSRPSP